MIIKRCSKSKKIINNIKLRMRSRGCRNYQLFDLVVLHKKSRNKKGLVLDKLGIWNPNYNNKVFFFNSSKLYYWMEKGLVVNYKVKRHIMRFLF